MLQEDSGYSDKERREIIERALDLQHRPSQGEGEALRTIEEVERIGAEAGIPAVINDAAGGRPNQDSCAAKRALPRGGNLCSDRGCSGPGGRDPRPRIRPLQHAGTDRRLCRKLAPGPFNLPASVKERRPASPKGCACHPAGPYGHILERKRIGRACASLFDGLVSANYSVARMGCRYHST